MKKKSFIVAALLGSVLILFLFIWNEQREQSRELVPPEEQTITINGESLPTQPDVMLAIDPASQTVLSHLYEGLYRFGSDGSIEPALVEKLERSDDGTVYTFTLKESVTTEGNAITAQTFVDHFRKLVDDDTNSPFSFLLADVKAAKEIGLGQQEPDALGVRAIDDRTLELTLIRPMKGFEKIFAMPAFLPQPSVTSWEELETNGPFELNQMDDTSISLHKNETYREADQVTLETISIRNESNLSEVSGMHPIPYDFDTSTVDKEVMNIKDVPRSGVFYLKPNVEKAPFDDVAFRQALALTLERTTLEESLARSEQTTERLLVMDEEAAVVELEGDADQLFETVKKRLKTETIEIELLSFVDEEAREISTKLKNNLEQLDGLTVNVVELPLGEKVRKEVSGDYSFSLSGWQPDYPMLSAYLTQFESDDVLNSSRYRSESYDQLMDEARSTESLEERNTILRNAEAKLLEEAVVMPIYQAGRSYLVEKGYDQIGYPVIGPSYVLTFSKKYEN
ncbi:peptide ABC transporter substrate-binding protein [Exiguobacterium aestuarii]|uniref:Peptide ABC transporter substrate-binding protein n=1 Tax=Exiguobacterium aestuarii TaxID=273527 RepID=A0ABW2PSW0_9BACL|nr:MULTISPECIES: peptide ABC transporter substrate-binding protein [Exiguobacterium]MCT4785518.1 peptide ABC transporter substrate-binding protein [Exiguobacterium aestuarii]